MTSHKKFNTEELTMSFRGNSERQAFLRDQRINKRTKTSRSRYVSEILFSPQMKILDIGCGTANITQELASARPMCFPSSVSLLLSFSSERSMLLGAAQIFLLCRFFRWLPFLAFSFPVHFVFYQ